MVVLYGHLSFSQYLKLKTGYIENNNMPANILCNIY